MAGGVARLAVDVDRGGPGTAQRRRTPRGTRGADLAMPHRHLAAVGHVDALAAMIHLHLMRFGGERGAKQQPGSGDEAHEHSPSAVPRAILPGGPIDICRPAHAATASRQAETYHYIGVTGPARYAWRMSRFLAPAALFAACLATPVAATGLSPAEARMKATIAADAARNEALLERLVLQNSGTLNLPGVARVGEMMRAELAPLGFDVRWVDMKDTG
ncbi:hypothetical protein LTR94_029638, partial [Friedmanniomyces endolithicus]